MHNLISIELAYVNTKHPDFTDAAQVSVSVNSQQVLTFLWVIVAASNVKPILLEFQTSTLRISGFFFVRQRLWTEASIWRMTGLKKEKLQLQALAVPEKARPWTGWTQWVILTNPQQCKHDLLLKGIFQLCYLSIHLCPCFLKKTC